MFSGLSWWFSSKESACHAGDAGSTHVLGRSPGGGHGNPCPRLEAVFLPGESHGQRSLAGYSVWGCKRVRHNLGTKQQQNVQHCPALSVTIC